MKKWAVGGALASERSRGLSGPQSEPGTQSHGRVHARETEDEGRTGEQRGGRSTGPSSAGRQQLGGLGKCVDFASPAPFPSDRA